MRRAFPASILIIFLLAPTVNTYAWSNGGYSADINNPDYGTHDWIAEHALDWVPATKKQYIVDNLSAYIFGTELPDLPSTQGGIGDTTKHHIYYRADGTLQDGAAATRAEEEYQAALSYLNAGNRIEAAKHAGAMAHYVSDMAAYGHVMGSNTDWGSETTAHHSGYEDYVDSRTDSYSKVFVKPLVFDGELTQIDAATAAKQLASDTTFDVDGDYTASWMEANYDLSGTTFNQRSWESINLATNLIADALASLYDAYQPPKTPTTITCTPSKTSALDTEQLTVSGAISADVSATITISRLVGSSWIDLATTTSGHGSYSTQIVLPVGSSNIRASWTGDAVYDAATSQTATITITRYTPPKAQTSITLTPSKTTAKENEQITFSGAISADVSTTVTIYRKVGGDWVAHATTPATHGAYSTQTSFTAGSYTLRVGWEGDATHVAATSPETGITVQPRTGSMKVTVVDEKDVPIIETTLIMTATPSGQTQLQTTTSSDGSVTFSAIKPGTYTFNATKNGYKTNTGTCQVEEDQTITVKVTLTKENTGIPGYPIASVSAGMTVILGYFIIFRMNRNKSNKSNKLIKS